MRTSPQGFQFFGHNGSQKVLSSLSVVSVRVSSSYSRSSLKFFSSAGSIQEFSVLQVCCSLVFFSSHKKHSSSSSVQFFGSVFSALTDFRFSRRVAADTLDKYSSLLVYSTFEDFSAKLIQTPESSRWAWCQRTNRRTVSSRYYSTVLTFY